MDKTNVTAGIEEKNPSAKKSSRRSVGNARGTTRLKFSHEHAKSNGLFLAHLTSVEVSDFVCKQNSNMASFIGMNVPRISFSFESQDEDPAKRKYAVLSFNAVESLADRIPGGAKEWVITSVFDWLKHILNVYLLKGREMTDEEVDALSLDYEDFDERGEYVPVDAEVILSAWRKLFDNFASLMNTGNNGKPCYRTAENKDITVWIKLLRYIKARGQWTPINNGELTFPTFVGEGCIEIYRQNNAPALRINLIRECITPKNIDKPKHPNLPAGGIQIVGEPMTEPLDYDAISQEADADLPF